MSKKRDRSREDGREWEEEGEEEWEVVVVGVGIGIWESSGNVPETGKGHTKVPRLEQP